MTRRRRDIRFHCPVNTAYELDSRCTEQQWAGQQARISLDRYFAVLRETLKESRDSDRIPRLMEPHVSALARAPFSKRGLLDTLYALVDDPATARALLERRSFAQLVAYLDLAEQWHLHGLPHPNADVRWKRRKRSGAPKGAKRSVGLR